MEGVVAVAYFLLVLCNIILIPQEVGVGHGVKDIASFLCVCLDVKVRRQYEQQLLSLYHSSLIQQGIKEYSFAR